MYGIGYDSNRRQFLHSRSVADGNIAAGGGAGAAVHEQAYGAKDDGTLLVEVVVAMSAESAGIVPGFAEEIPG